MEISSFWREIQLSLERAGETYGEFVSLTWIGSYSIYNMVGLFVLPYEFLILSSRLLAGDCRNW